MAETATTTIRIESAKCKVINLAAAAEDYDETPEDVSWFDRLHPSIVKPYDCTGSDENTAPDGDASSAAGTAGGVKQAGKPNKSRGAGISNAGASSGRPKQGAAAVAANATVTAAAVADDDDIMAMLAKHNKQFKPKSQYVARTHSARDVKKWEVRWIGGWMRTRRRRRRSPSPTRRFAVS